MIRRVVEALFLTTCVVASVACSPGPSIVGSDTVPPVASPATAAAPAAAAPVMPASRPDHAVIVMLENKDEADAMREGPYLVSLAASGAALTDMHAETHPSQPNYLALFSGDTQGITDDRCPLTFDTPNLATQ